MPVTNVSGIKAQPPLFTTHCHVLIIQQGIFTTDQCIFKPCGIGCYCSECGLTFQSSAELFVYIHTENYTYEVKNKTLL